MNDLEPGYDLSILFLMASRVLVDELHNQLAAAGFSGIRPAHGFAFQLLAPNGATVNELGEHLGVTKQAASQMVDYLVTTGFVTRETLHSDKRNKLIKLTPKGWECISIVEEILKRLEDRWKELLGTKNVSNLKTDLSRLIRAENKGNWPKNLRPAW